MSFRNLTRLSAAGVVLACTASVAAPPTIRSKTFESLSPNGKVSILSRCDGERRRCDVVALSGKKEVEIGPRGYPSGPTIHWVNLDTAAVEFKCGEGCRNAWFYNPRLGASVGYRGMLAVDGIRMRVAVANESQQEIEVLPIHSQPTAPTCRVRREWSPTGAFAMGGKIVAAVFRSNGDLKLEFRKADGKVVAETIAIDKAGGC